MAMAAKMATKPMVWGLVMMLSFASVGGADDSDRGARRGPSLAPGEPIPELWLPTTRDAKPVSTRDFVGGVPTVLHVFASW